MTIDEKLDLLITNQQKMQADILDIKVHLENITDKNSQIGYSQSASLLAPNLIAEGHIDLTRKLNGTLKVENEKELLLIRMNYLENEMKKVKERLDQIA